MDKKTGKLLIKKAKKKSKFYEGVFVNPIFWEVNGKRYYMAGFTVGNTPKATAYFTTVGDEKREEAEIAQSYLSLFSDTSNNIFRVGGEHLKIDTAYYTKPLEIPVNSSEIAVIEGHESFKHLWEVQQKFNQLTNDYHRFHDGLLQREQLTQKDIDHNIEIVNWVNLYQYETLSILVDQNNRLRAYFDYLETTKEWKDLSRDQRTFVTGITKNIAKMQENRRSLNLIESNDPEKMFALNLEKAKSDLRIGIEKQKEYIRYPK
ncbi:MAG: hypothetical protein ABS916_08685 [Carnobacterium sp.]|uniref:hypothetical protein n=1 Tax=Carnobacterium sp. TaxID=48221 RepID=UPI0033161D45